MNMLKILIVEDDVSLGGGVSMALKTKVTVRTDDNDKYNET